MRLLVVLCLLVDRVIIAVLLCQKFSLVVPDAFVVFLLLAEALILIFAWAGERLLGFDCINTLNTRGIAHVFLAARVVRALLQHLYIIS